MGRVPWRAMVFSAKTEYGLVALIDLAAAYTTGERVQTGEISRRHGMPERYLEQMLTSLRKGGYLVSVRGPRGGYQLTRSPELITVSEVEECLEGESHAERQGDRSNAEFRVLDGLAHQAEKARKMVLQSTTLAQLLAGRDSLRQPSPMFYI
jgi:Rrf2 family transcriptional regulator, cysteine metabolism repressor